jgi:hypothetical protein
VSADLGSPVVMTARPTSSSTSTRFVEDVQKVSVGDKVTVALDTDPRTGRPEAKLVTLIDD